MSENEAKQREIDCQALEEETGLCWEPYYQNTSQGPEQNILFYIASLTGNGKIVDYDKAFEVSRAAKDEGFADINSMDFSLLGIGFDKCRDQGHIASAILIRKETVRTSDFTTRLRSSEKLKGVFAELSAIPETPGISDVFEQYTSRQIGYDQMLDAVKVAITASFGATGAPAVKGFTHS